MIKDEFQQMQLMAGKFTPYEANKLVMEYLQGSENHFKSQYLMQWERNHSMEMTLLEEQMAVLNSQREQLKEMMEEAKKLGCQLSIKSSLQIELIQP